MWKVAFKGNDVPVTVSGTIDAELAMNTDLFKGWLANLDPSFDLKSVEFQSVDKFGTGRVGFIKFIAHIERNGIKIPGIVLLRGPAVAILLIISDESTGEEWTILTEQPRVPAGKLLLEIPAGMTDSNGNLKGVAVKELEEECGLVAKPDDLIDLTELTYGKTQSGVYMSAGLCDETLRLFLWKLSMTHERLTQLEGKLGGEDAHEQIVLRLVKFRDVWRTGADAKALASLALYHYLKEEGRI
jgi:ADP-sugar diphosphatase